MPSGNKQPVLLSTWSYWWSFSPWWNKAASMINKAHSLTNSAFSEYNRPPSSPWERIISPKLISGWDNMTCLNTTFCHNHPSPHLDESLRSCSATTQQQFFRHRATRERLFHSDGTSTANLPRERLFCWEVENSVTWGIIMHHSFPCNLTLGNKSIMYSLVYWADLQHFKWKDDFLLLFSCWHQQIQRASRNVALL